MELALEKGGEVSNEEQFEIALQNYALLEDRFEEAVKELCGEDAMRAVEIIEQHRAILKATVEIDRARAVNPALDAYVTAWVTKNGGDPLPVRSDGGFVN